MGLRSIIDLNKLRNPDLDKEKIREDLSADLSGCLLFGLAGFNLFPGCSKVAALGFSLYSWIKVDETSLAPSNDYFTARVIAFPKTIVREIRAHFQLPNHPSWILLILLISAVTVYKFTPLCDNLKNILMILDKVLLNRTN